MTKKQRKNPTFIATYCRAGESKLIGSARFKRAAESADLSDAVAIIKESGFGGGESFAAEEYEKLVSAEEKAFVSFIESYAPDDETELYFLLPYDFYNAEALVKCHSLGFDPEKYTGAEGEYTAAELSDYILNGKDCGLIKELKFAIDEANALLKSGAKSGMQINALFIRQKYACLSRVCGHGFLSEALCDEIIAANISACLRSENADYAKKMLISVKCGKKTASLTSEQISALIEKNETKAKSAFSGGAFEKLAPLSIEKSKKGLPLTELENYASSAGVTLLNDKKFTDLSGAFVFSSYAYRRKNEIACARLCLTCKANGAPSDEILKRLSAV